MLIKPFERQTLLTLNYDKKKLSNKMKGIPVYKSCSIYLPFSWLTLHCINNLFLNNMFLRFTGLYTPA
jgi:hypothetical protein